MMNEKKEFKNAEAEMIHFAKTDDIVTTSDHTGPTGTFANDIIIEEEIDLGDDD